MNDTILATFTAKVQSASELASRLQGFLEDHMGATPEEITWAHVGDAGRIVAALQDLDQVFGFLKHGCTPAAAPEQADCNAQIQTIARECLGLETLASQGSDRLDFHDLGVASIRRALEAAFQAGKSVRK